MARTKANGGKSRNKINSNVKIGQLNYEAPETWEHRCTACGKVYKRQKGNFCTSSSPMFASNDGYVYICKHCTEKLYNNYVEFFCGNEEKAMIRMCQIFDWYYLDRIFDATKKTANQTPRVFMYTSKANLPQFEAKGKTYADTIKESSEDTLITNHEQLYEMREQGKITIAQAAIDRFGIGIGSESDYKVLDDHYKMLKRANPNCDSNQEIFIKALCNLYLLQVRAMQNNDTKAYIDANSEYTKTFKQAGLKTIQDDEKNADDCWGIFMEQISQYTPEEYYKDKKLFKDFDGIGEFMKRFVLRPLKNLLCKQNVRDKEYSIPEDGQNV